MPAKGFWAPSKRVGRLVTQTLFHPSTVKVTGGEGSSNIEGLAGRDMVFPAFFEKILRMKKTTIFGSKAQKNRFATTTARRADTTCKFKHDFLTSSFPPNHLAGLPTATDMLLRKGIRNATTGVFVVPPSVGSAAVKRQSYLRTTK